MRTAQVQEQQPPQTVAQDVMAPQPPMQPPMQPGMEQGMDQGMGMPQEMAQGATQGLPSLPIDPRMFNEQSYAGGGIVAFQTGGEARNPYRNYIPGRGSYRLPPEEEERLRREGLLPEDFKKPTFRETLQKIRERVIDPTAAYLTSDPVRRMIQGEPDDRMASGSDLGKMDIGFGPGRFSPVYGPQDVAGASDVQIPGLDMGAAQQPPAADPLAPQGINFADIIRDTKRIAGEFVPAPSAVVPTPEEASRQTEESLRLAGFDPDLFKKQREQLEKEKASLAEDRKTAQNMRIIEAGLGIMSGTSANAFENIGKGATPAVQGLAKDIKDLKAAERAFTNAQMDLDSKQNDFALGKAKINQGVIDKAQNRRDQQEDRVYNARAKIGGIFLDAKLKEQLAKETGLKATDLDKDWARYSAEEIAAGRTPSFSGFQAAKAGTRAQLTYKDVALALVKDNPNIAPEELDARVNQILLNQQRALSGQQSIAPPKSAIDALKKNTSLRNQFDEKYGAGSAARYLGQ